MRESGRAVYAAVGGISSGLILLFDVLQSTYKTFDDVARSLPVPALGGISHLELEEDIRASKVRRLKITVVTVFVLALVGAVFALYLVDPVRLPTWLRDAFDRIFATGE